MLYHPNRISFRVKSRARKKVVERKGTIFTRCSIYCASNHKTSNQRERMRVESLNVVSHSTLLFLCQFSFNSNSFQGKRASEEKSGRSKKNHIIFLHSIKS